MKFKLLNEGINFKKINFKDGTPYDTDGIEYIPVKFDDIDVFDPVSDLKNDDGTYNFKDTDFIPSEWHKKGFFDDDDSGLAANDKGTAGGKNTNKHGGGENSNGDQEAAGDSSDNSANSKSNASEKSAGGQNKGSKSSNKPGSDDTTGSDGGESNKNGENDSSPDKKADKGNQKSSGNNSGSQDTEQDNGHLTGVSNKGGRSGANTQKSGGSSGGDSGDSDDDGQNNNSNNNNTTNDKEPDDDDDAYKGKGGGGGGRGRTKGKPRFDKGKKTPPDFGDPGDLVDPMNYGRSTIFEYIIENAKDIYNYISRVSAQDTMFNLDTALDEVILACENAQSNIAGPTDIDTWDTIYNECTNVKKEIDAYLNVAKQHKNSSAAKNAISNLSDAPDALDIFVLDNQKHILRRTPGLVKLYRANGKSYIRLNGQYIEWDDYEL